MMRVLVVDDSDANRYLLQALLTGHGHQPVLAADGAQALELAAADPPDLVISDLLMPVMDGYMLLRRWRADPMLSTIPFVVYTATYTDPEDERLALDLGADAFVLKPADPEALMTRMEEVHAAASAAGTRKAVERPDDQALLDSYSAALIRKLEDKMLQLEQANKALTDELAEGEAARRRIAQQARLLDQTHDAIVVHELDHRVRYWNRGATTMLGWTPDEALGRPVTDLHLPNADQVAAAMAAVTDRGTWDGELRMVAKDGRELLVDARWTRVPAEAGLPMRVLVAASDVTERRRTEAQLLRVQRLEGIGRLAGGIAHDLNNLLSPILMGVELLRAHVADPQGLELLHTIEHSSQRSAQLVDQILSFARGVEGQRMVVDLRQVVEDVTDLMRSTFPRNVRVHATCPEDLPTVIGDHTQLHQVLLNLCVNARDALSDGGDLRVGVSVVEVDPAEATPLALTPGRFVRIEVADNGVGMSTEVQERIFEPFFTTKAPGDGTGLGLSTSLAIVRSHGGAIDVHSTADRGTTFTVLLPAGTPAVTAAPAADPPSDAAAGQPPPATVLVVDDDEHIRYLTGHVLTAAGHQVLTAADGEEALQLYDREGDRVSVVLTDLVMPVMGGAALIEVLRARRPDLPIVAMSGFDPGRATGREHAAGADHFLAKPFATADLLAVVNRLLAT